MEAAKYLELKAGSSKGETGSTKREVKTQHRREKPFAAPP